MSNQIAILCWVNENVRVVEKIDFDILNTSEQSTTGQTQNK